jgi:hypothetical protein
LRQHLLRKANNFANTGATMKKKAAAQSIADLMAKRYTLTSIADHLRGHGVSASVSHLSRVLYYDREAGEQLRAALQELAKELGK